MNHWNNSNKIVYTANDEEPNIAQRLYIFRRNDCVWICSKVVVFHFENHLSLSFL